MGEAWRPVLAPRITPSGEHVAVSLARAIEQRAVVLWRTYVDDMPKEAAMITVLALADMYAAAQVAGAPWTLLLDEFGGVMHIAANRALAMLQRGRSHHGQVIVVTQSAADPEALTGQPGLLASLTDNFTGFAIHRQNAPETRDWLAKLMGTTALWQSTDQTTGHGSAHSGQGSRRRVRQFRVGSDTFAELGRGEAIIYSTIDGHPRRAHVLRARLPAPRARTDRRGRAARLRDRRPRSKHARAAHPRRCDHRRTCRRARLPRSTNRRPCELFGDGPDGPAVTRLLIAVLTWRLARRLAAPAIVIALAMLLLHSGSFARHDRPQTLGAAERVVQPIEHDLQHALGRALRP